MGTNLNISVLCPSESEAVVPFLSLFVSHMLP